MKYYHVDVFSKRAPGGNGLTVVFPDEPLSSQECLDIAREFNQFESIFLYPMDDGVFRVRIFTVDEELMFAGHPILGAGAVIHEINRGGGEANISFLLGERYIRIHSLKKEEYYQVTMNQGEATILGNVEKSEHYRIAKALNLHTDDIDADYQMEVVSTGLPYLLVPVTQNLEHCRIMHTDFEAFLSAYGAKFVYVFDTNTLQCRTWDNSGKVEDVATGSAAGPLCAYLVKNNRAKTGETITIHQGEFAGRSSIIRGWTTINAETFISGDVSFFASGNILYYRGI